MKQCENCGIEITGKEFGAGRFCCERCAKSFAASKKNWGRPISYTCETCGKSFERKRPIHVGRKVTCNNCKNSSPHFKEKYNSLLDFSTRTVAKILYRLKIPCSLCGWNAASCDVHHIIPKKAGGSNDNKNLIIVCPNCHRIIHNNINPLYTIDYLMQFSVDHQWDLLKSNYHPSN